MNNYAINENKKKLFSQNQQKLKVKTFKFALISVFLFLTSISLITYSLQESRSQANAGQIYLPKNLNNIQNLAKNWILIYFKSK